MSCYPFTSSCSGGNGTFGKLKGAVLSTFLHPFPRFLLVEDHAGSEGLLPPFPSLYGTHFYVGGECARDREKFRLMPSTPSSLWPLPRHENKLPPFPLSSKTKTQAKDDWQLFFGRKISSSVHYCRWVHCFKGFFTALCSILGHGGWLQEGGRNCTGKGRGGIEFRSGGGGGTFGFRRGEGRDRAWKVVLTFFWRF